MTKCTYDTLQVFGVGVHEGSVKDVHKKDSILIFPHIESIKLTQTQVLSASDISLHYAILLCTLRISLPSFVLHDI